MKRFITAITILSLTSTLVVTPFVYAQGADSATSGQALEIAPPSINLTADPGQVIDAQISLRDISPVPIVVTSEVNDFTSDPETEDGTPKIMLNSTEPSPHSLIGWIAPLPPLTLKPRQVENLPIKITVPANAAPGGYYGTIRFTAQPPDMQDTGVALNASLGALIMVRVNGETKEAMTLSEFYVSKNGNRGGLFENLPITFTERIKNDGNVFEQPRGEILLKNVFGKTVAKVNVNLENRNILPQSVRKFEQEFTAHDLGNTFMFGPYTAELSMKYGTAEQTITGRTSFWIIPWKLILGIIAAIIVIVLATKLMVQRHNDKIVRRSRGSRRR